MAQTFKPHDYQQEAMAHLYKVRRSALWMPMGGGKTVSTLTALDNLSTVEDVFPVLVLAPLRVARSTWPDEVAKWPHLSHLRVSVITGTPKQRQAALDTPADIYCTNYDNLVWLRTALGDAWPFKTVVADEFTRLKSYRIRQGGSRARALGQVAHTHVTRFIGLTGTPAPNGVKDLWGQIWFLDQGERLGKTFSAFESRWFRKGYDGYSLVPHDHTQGEVEEKLKDICLTVQGLQVDEPITTSIFLRRRALRTRRWRPRCSPSLTRRVSRHPMRRFARRSACRSPTGLYTRMTRECGRMCTPRNWMRWRVLSRRPTERRSLWPITSSTISNVYKLVSVKVGCWTLTLIRSGSGTPDGCRYYSLTLRRRGTD